MDGKIKKFWRYIFNHALVFAGVGLVFTGFVYFNVLSLRNALVGGYFSNPALTTMSEVIFWFMGAFIGLTAGALLGVIRHGINSKRKRK